MPERDFELPEPGDYPENESLFFIARYELRNGHARDGVKGLLRLRQHILAIRDPKSERILLPVIDQELRAYAWRCAWE